jgi:hypothetical protein
MGFFSSIISGGIKLISGGKQRKEARRQSASDERLAKISSKNLLIQSQNSDKQRAHELAMFSSSNNKKGFIPWVIGGFVALISVIGMISMKPKNRRR